MKKLLAIAAFSLLAIGLPTTPVLAQEVVITGMDEVDPNDPCIGVVVTSELVACLREDLEEVDAELNALYKRIVTHPDTDEATRVALRDAQRAWITFRDNACKAESIRYYRYTKYGPALYACLETETRNRRDSIERAFIWRLEK